MKWLAILFVCVACSSESFEAGHSTESAAGNGGDSLTDGTSPAASGSAAGGQAIGGAGAPAIGGQQATGGSRASFGGQSVSTGGQGTGGLCTATEGGNCVLGGPTCGACTCVTCTGCDRPLWVCSSSTGGTRA